MLWILPTWNYKRLNALARSHDAQVLTALPFADIRGVIHFSPYEKNVHDYYAAFVNNCHKYFGLGILFTIIPKTKLSEYRAEFIQAIKKYRAEIHHNMNYPGF